MASIKMDISILVIVCTCDVLRVLEKSRSQVVEAMTMIILVAVMLILF